MWLTRATRALLRPFVSTTTKTTSIATGTPLERFWGLHEWCQQQPWHNEWSTKGFDTQLIEYIEKIEQINKELLDDSNFLEDLAEGENELLGELEAKYKELWCAVWCCPLDEFETNKHKETIVEIERMNKKLYE